LAVSNQTLPPPSYANPRSTMPSTNVTISGMYSETRVSVVGRSTRRAAIDVKNESSQKAARSRKMAGSVTLAPNCVRAAGRVSS